MKQVEQHLAVGEARRTGTEPAPYIDEQQQRRSTRTGMCGRGTRGRGRAAVPRVVVRLTPSPPRFGVGAAG